MKEFERKKKSRRKRIYLWLTCEVLSFDHAVNVDFVTD